MKTIKIIDLLNKIANGEEVPKKIKFDNQIWNINYGEKNIYYTNDNWNDLFIIIFRKNLHFTLNDKVEILEDEKKMPEKLPYYSLEKIQKAKNKDEWKEERISLLEKRTNDYHEKINEILDYLESEGE